jgi:hypothetical protein
MISTEPKLDQKSLEFAAFDIIKRRKRITLFKLGKLWVFKYFLDDKETFKALAEAYNEDKYRFEFKTFGERNNALKILERMGYDYELVEDLRPFIVKLNRFSKYGPILKNSVSYVETPNSRIFLMKDMAAAEEAVRLGAKVYEGDYGSLVFR